MIFLFKSKHDSLNQLKVIGGFLYYETFMSLHKLGGCDCTCCRSLPTTIEIKQKHCWNITDLHLSTMLCSLIILDNFCLYFCDLKGISSQMEYYCCNLIKVEQCITCFELLCCCRRRRLWCFRRSKWSFNIGGGICCCQFIVSGTTTWNWCQTCWLLQCKESGSLFSIHHN